MPTESSGPGWGVIFKKPNQSKVIFNLAGESIAFFPS